MPIVPMLDASSNLTHSCSAVKRVASFRSADDVEKKSAAGTTRRPGWPVETAKEERATRAAELRVATVCAASREAGRAKADERARVDRRADMAKARGKCLGSRKKVCLEVQ